jgi:type VI secretion system secreted protein VgrG
MPDLAFNDRFVLLDDETGEPVALTEYAVEREDGRIEHGVTNERGETHLVSASTAPEKIKIYIAVEI